MGEGCFISVRIGSIGRKGFMYMDASDGYRADALFEKHGVHVKFHHNEFISPDGKYLMVCCSIPKKEIPKFEKAMGELANNMLLLGYKDYRSVWERILSFFEENKRK